MSSKVNELSTGDHVDVLGGDAMIGYLVDPPAAMVNTTGDALAATKVTRLLEGKDGMKKKLTEAETE